MKSPFIYSYFLSGSATLNRHHLIALNGKKVWEQQKCLCSRSEYTPADSELSLQRTASLHIRAQGVFGGDMDGCVYVSCLTH